MADTVKFFRWDNSETATKLVGIGSSTGLLTLHDDTFGQAQRYKRVYGVRMTYKSGGAVAKNSALTYAANGSTTFSGSSLPSSNFDSASGWNTDAAMFTSPQSVSSIRFNINFSTTGITSINNFEVEARAVYKRTT